MSAKRSRRPDQLAAVLNASWVSAVELRRLLGWRSRIDGEPMTVPAFATALARAAAPLIAAAQIEEKFERGAAGRPMRFLRRCVPQQRSKTR